MKKSEAMQLLETIAGEEFTFATMMRVLRQRKEMTQEQFGKLLGVQKAYICDIERGRRNITIDQAIKFAGKLEDVVSTKQFIEMAVSYQLKKNGLDYDAVLVANG